MCRETAKLKRLLERGVVSEREYYYKRHDIALHAMRPERQQRYFELVSKTKISDRVAQNQDVCGSNGRILIAAISGATNALIVVVTFAKIILYWNHRVETVEMDAEDSIDNAIWRSSLRKEAIDGGASLLRFYDPDMMESL